MLTYDQKTSLDVSYMTTWDETVIHLLISYIKSHTDERVMNERVSTVITRFR